VLFVQDRHRRQGHRDEMLAGAMQELRIGDPAELPPMSARSSTRRLAQGARGPRRRLDSFAMPIYTCALDDEAPPRHLLRPARLRDRQHRRLEREVFGPILHVVRWRPTTSTRSATPSPPATA
jgi:delta 1-pyrroline-5-carboxylate dehydrogenase